MTPARWVSLQWQLIRPYGRQLYYKAFPRRRPDYFQKPWTYPGGRLGLDPVDLQTAEDFVCFFLPMTDWHFRIQRSQQLAKAIAASGRHCVYVNPHLGLEYPRPYWLDRHTRFSWLAQRLLELHVHLPREHELNQRALTPPECRRIAAEIGRLIEISGIRKAALIVSFPAWLGVAESLSRQYGMPLIYDCHDWLPGFRRIAPRILELERDLLHRADLVVFSSQDLMDRIAKSQVDLNCALIRNATDLVIGERDMPKSAPSAEKTIGYLGALDEWFDVAAVAQGARDHPGWKFVLAGRVEDQRILKLNEHRNVVFAGEVPHSAIAAHLAGWDVATIPFLVNDLTVAANPIKLYEYFSAGLPVVSSRLPEVELYRDMVYIADTPQEFSAMLDRAVHEDPALRNKRTSASRAETWSARAEVLLELIMPLASKKRASGIFS
jgi:glycosyltransferase involved in cell wall biosynthesis